MHAQVEMTAEQVLLKYDFNKTQRFLFKERDMFACRFSIKNGSNMVAY